MTLSVEERNTIMRRYVQEEHVNKNSVANVSTSEIITEALNMDSFITSNLSAINNAYSVSFRNKTTPKQRLKHFKLVVAALELQ